LTVLLHYIHFQCKTFTLQLTILSCHIDLKNLHVILSYTCYCLVGKITHWEWRHTRYYWSCATEQVWPAINVENSRESNDVCSATWTHAAIDFRSCEGDTRCNCYWEIGPRKFRWAKKFSSFFSQHGFGCSWELPLDWWFHCTTTTHCTIEWT